MPFKNFFYRKMSTKENPIKDQNQDPKGKELQMDQNQDPIIQIPKRNREAEDSEPPNKIMFIER